MAAPPASPPLLRRRLTLEYLTLGWNVFGTGVVSAAQQAQEDADGSGLASPIWAEEAVNLARLDGQVQAIERGHVAEALDQARHADSVGCRVIPGVLSDMHKNKTPLPLFLSRLLAPGSRL